MAAVCAPAGCPAVILSAVTVPECGAINCIRLIAVSRVIDRCLCAGNRKLSAVKLCLRWASRQLVEIQLRLRDPYRRLPE